LSDRDACVVQTVEYNHDATVHGVNGDTTGRKSSLLSSASDYARSISVEQQTHSSNINRAGSPYSDKTVSFFDERSKVKTK